MVTQKHGMTIAAPSTVPNVADRVSRIVAFVAGVTERRRAAEMLRQGEERYRAMVESMDDAVNLKDRDGRYLVVNAEQARRLGRRKEDIVGRRPWDVHDGATAKRIMEHHMEVIRTGTTLETEEELPGHPNPMVCHIHRIPLKTGSGDVAAVVTVSRDITEMARKREVLRYQAFEDELTGLYNRRGFMAVAEHQLRLADRMGTRVSLLFIDMDDLKAVNDGFGHHKGDEAIAVMAKALRENCRESDVVARFGGDEFAVLVIDTPPAMVAALVQRVRNALSAVNVKQWSFHPLSLSAGLAHRDAGCPVSINELLLRADGLMYEEKRGKRQAS